MKNSLGYLISIVVCLFLACIAQDKLLMHDWLTAAFVGYVMFAGEFWKEINKK